MRCALELELRFNRSLIWHRFLLLHVDRACVFGLLHHAAIVMFYKAIPQEECYLICVLMYVCVNRYLSVSVDEMSPLSIMPKLSLRDEGQD